MKNLIVIFSIPVFVLTANVANAYDFYGASVTVKEVSTSMWRMGINGNYPIIDSVTLDSPAAKAGLSQGNIILSVNDKVIKTVADLDTFTTNILSMKILKGYSRETILIDRNAIEAEKTKHIEEERKSIVEVAAPIRNTQVEDRLNNLPPIVFDDAKLEKEYGKSTPAELLKQSDKRIDALMNNIKEITSESAKKIKDLKDERQRVIERGEEISRKLREKIGNN